MPKRQKTAVIIIAFTDDHVIRDNQSRSIGHASITRTNANRLCNVQIFVHQDVSSSAYSEALLLLSQDATSSKRCINGVDRGCVTLNGNDRL